LLLSASMIPSCPKSALALVSTFAQSDHLDPL
jgi:hypothetical protein